MELLVETVGNPAERNSRLVVTEILAQSGPLIEGVIDVCDGVLDDVDKVRRGLRAIRKGLKSLTFDSLLQVDPNPLGQHHADPVVWTKLVAPFGAPTREDEPGFSGTETPTFQMLDAFFSRKEYGSELGREAHHNLAWLPEPFQHFRASGLR